MPGIRAGRIISADAVRVNSHETTGCLRALPKHGALAKGRMQETGLTMDSMIVTIAVLLFLGLDLGFVALALLWLSERRVADDKADARNRDRPIKYK
jgi:hypothetical protein